MRAKDALVTAAWLFLSGAAVAFGGTTQCRVCDQPIAGKFFFAEDKARGGKFEVCGDCVKLESHCFACGLPVKSGFTTLPDGRFLCLRCIRDAVVPDEESKKICLETRDDLDRLFSRYLSFPQTNLVLTIVDRFTLESLFKSPGYARECSAVFGATQSHSVGDRKHIHSINILSSLSKIQLEAVAAHEFGHAWINEQLSTDRKAALSKDALEAFCELIAYNLMEERRADYQMKAIKANRYTRGQLEVFLTAEARHGFNAILDWMRSGESDKLDATDPDGVRMTHATEVASTPVTPPYHLLNGPPVKMPERLTLRSISGPSTRRLAIINDQTFGVMDRAQVRLARTNFLIRCLEIRTNSVLIRFEDSGVKQELSLPEG